MDLILSDFAHSSSGGDLDVGGGGGDDGAKRRKRGRPPLQSGPLRCDECDIKFEMVKELRQHLVCGRYHFTLQSSVFMCLFRIHTPPIVNLNY